MFFKRTHAERRLMLLLNHPDVSPDLPADEVEALLVRGAKANTILPPDGGSFLALTAIWGNVGVARVLLSHGADPNGNQLRRHVPLSIAVQNAHTEFIDLLLSAGADINVRDSRGQTGLFTALTMDKPRGHGVPEQLLRSGIDPSIRDKEGRTALETLEHFTQMMSNSPYDHDGGASRVSELNRMRVLIARSL